jgi:Ala-tRNA(Pro) deacylase
MDCKERLERYLRDNSVPFELQHHPLAYTAQAVAESEHVPGRLVAKVVMVYADGRLTMLALPAPARVDLARAAAAMGAKEVRLAHEEEFRAAFADCQIGAMPPFGNLYGVPTFVERSLAEDESIIFQAGTHTDTIRVAYKDYDRVVKPVVAEFAHGTRAGTY